MRNDDPMYVRQLEQAVEAAELEIKGLLKQIREQDKLMAEMHKQLAPKFMGEPLVQKIRSAQIKAGEDAVIANLRRMGLA
jgi:chaperonin cofactor prefoldin